MARCMSSIVRVSSGGNDVKVDMLQFQLPSKTLRLLIALCFGSLTYLFARQLPGASYPTILLASSFFLAAVSGVSGLWSP